jgi:hypothetical protein
MSQQQRPDAIRDRVKSLVRIKGRDLAPNPKNWRKHPKAQRDALKTVLAEVGFAGVALARETDEGIVLIDGHLRAEVADDQEMPVLILDVTAEEADKILATFDPLTELADEHSKKRKGLLRELRELKGQSLEFQMLLAGWEGEPSAERDGSDQPELEISAELHERQDYLVIVFDNEFDWKVACDKLGVTTVAGQKNETSTIERRGIGRVIQASRLLAALEK